MHLVQRGTVRGSTGGALQSSVHPSRVFPVDGCGGGGSSGPVGTSAEDTGSGSVGSSPTLTFHASPPGVAPGDSTTLTWAAVNVATCTASGGWSGSKALSGSEKTPPLSSDQTYQLVCTGPNGNALAMTTVTLRSADLWWTAPTRNTDGTPLTDLAGFKVQWGPVSRHYTASAGVTGAGTTTYQTLLDPGTWYFSVVAVNALGEESAPSNEVSKTVY